MYKAHIDAKNQQFVVEDKSGNIKLTMPFPTQHLQHLDAAEQVSLSDENSLAWERIIILVQAANKGLGSK